MRVSFRESKGTLPVDQQEASGRSIRQHKYATADFPKQFSIAGGACEKLKLDITQVFNP